MAQFSPFRIKLWDIDSSDRGRGNLKAIIEDATDIGVSAYVNEPGEMFYTVPFNHPHIGQMLPLERHYEVSRRDISTGAYSVIGMGLLEDFDSSKNEAVFYGVDYLGLITKNISSFNQSYTSELIGTIIDAQFTALQVMSNSPFKFWTKGTINASSRTVTVVTSVEERLAFWRGLCEILQGSGTTRPSVRVDRGYPPTFSFLTNRGSDKNDIRLKFGGAILDFRHVRGTTKLGTEVRALGVKREGASVLYSAQSYGDLGKYGQLEIAAYWTDIINGAELNDKALDALRESQDQPDELYISLASGYLAPYGGGLLAPGSTWDLSDSVPVVISRGPTSIDKLFTIWGFEWIGRRDGSEELFLDLLPKRI